MDETVIKVEEEIKGEPCYDSDERVEEDRDLNEELKPPTTTFLQPKEEMEGDTHEEEEQESPSTVFLQPKEERRGGTLEEIDQVLPSCCPGAEDIPSLLNTGEIAPGEFLAPADIPRIRSFRRADSSGNWRWLSRRPTYSADEVYKKKIETLQITTKLVEIQRELLQLQHHLHEHAGYLNRNRKGDTSTGNIENE